MFGVGACRSFKNGSRSCLNRCSIGLVLSAIARAICDAMVQFLVANGPCRVGIARRKLFCFAAKVSVIRVNVRGDFRRRSQIVNEAPKLLVRFVG